MKLDVQVDQIRSQIFKAFDKYLSMLGLLLSKEMDTAKVRPELQEERRRLDDILSNLKDETGGYEPAREKLLDELSFTLFNRIAGIKVMETRQLIPEVFVRRAEMGGKSFSHRLWLEEHQEKGALPLEGLREYVRYAFHQLLDRIQLYSPDYLFDALPDVYDLDGIIEAFNAIEESDWKSDDILGWLYETYNRKKQKAFKESGQKIEYNWVPVTSQVYTPRWVVEFILNNSLGKLWMEMHPESKLKEKHDIANIPDKPTLKAKPVEEIKVLDPACGSGNFLLYAFDLFYEMYLEQDYAEKDIPALIIKNNLFGIDLDDRAVQIARLGLYIKALQKNKDIKLPQMNVVSSDFYLPEYERVQDFFMELSYSRTAIKLLRKIWDDLRNAHKFGSLIRIEEKVRPILEKMKNPGQMEMFKKDQLTLGDIPPGTIFENIKAAVKKYSRQNNLHFFENKTIESMSFVEILLNKFDVVVANPPYTPSADFGNELKIFIEQNYKKPNAFHYNLYSSFFRRNSELIIENGKIGMVTPMTFMFIKTYEDMRKYILKNFKINIFVQFGFGGMFDASIDTSIFILEKTIYNSKSIFIKLDKYYSDDKKNLMIESLRKSIIGLKDKHLYLLDQLLLLKIKSYPFIYWISDEFREKFSEQPLDEFCDVKVGLQSGNNERFIRFWWEVDKNSISRDYVNDHKKWVLYAKGGTFEKWYGNLWLTVNWKNNGYEIKNVVDENGKQRSRPQNLEYYFQEGITYSASGRGGYAFRHLPPNHIFDVGGSSIFLSKNYKNILYLLAFLNSKLSFYIADCLNPTANIQVGDLKRIPFVNPTKELENQVSLLAEQNVSIKKHLCEFSIIETNYKEHPFLWARQFKPVSDLRQLIKTYVDYENEQLARVLLNEAVIDELIFEVYQLSAQDRQMVLDKEGFPAGSLPLLKGYDTFGGELPNFVQNYIGTLEVKDLNAQELANLKRELENLYKANTSLEDMALKTGVHPQSIMLLLKESHILPQKRMNDLAKDFIYDVLREILWEDDDGIIPLVDSAGEIILQKRLFDKLVAKGFSPTQIGNYKDILGQDLNAWLEKRFFADLSDRLNLFMYLPKTPFIWHLSSGPLGGFEAFVLIYKWSRDAMLRLRSVYVEKRLSSLRNRLLDLQKDDSVKAQSEREIIQAQIKEVEQFRQAIDEILQAGYDPKLDDGVGKNIAPLQEKCLLKANVLKPKQLEKYLHADW